MKKTRKLVAVVLALVLCFAMALPAMAASITITNSKAGHTYKAYQIFTGDVSGEKTKEGDTRKLANAKWGANMSVEENQKKLLEHYGATDIADLVKKIAERNDAADFAEFVQPLTNGEAFIAEYENDNYVIDDLAAGYYLIVDDDSKTLGEGDAYSAYIVQLLSDQEVATKATYPTVDKQVYDNADADAAAGWDETADHQIGETFQFKLTAKIPDSPDLAAYETYKLIFTDTMSDGVTFENIASVTITPQGSNAVDISEYKCTADEGQAGGEWTLTIEDIMKSGVNIQGATVEVVYNAHLNKAAQVNDPGDGAQGTENENKVSLQYSNNPNNSSSFGKAKEDKVFVFTYKLPGRKYHDEINEDDKEENVMAGAGFKLYKGVNEGAKTALWAVINNETGAVTWVEGDLDGTGVGTEFTSGEDGRFEFSGLDVGTYYLKETTTPEGYNTIADQTIVISATHMESSEDVPSVTVTMTADGTATAVDEIVNKSGSLLPSTGGIGTTIFYIVGICLVVGAVVILVTRKRVGKNS